MSSQIRVAVLGSYTTDFVVREASKQLASKGLDVAWYQAPFNQFRQELLSSSSPAREFAPHVVWLTLDAEVWLGDDHALEYVARAAQVFPDAAIFVHNCAVLASQPLQLLEWNVEGSVRVRVNAVNMELTRLARQYANVKILDLEGLVLRHGMAKMFDARFHYLAKAQYSVFGNTAVAEQLGLALAALRGGRKKVLVLDLDNTLWGGVLGDDGVEHLNLSNDGAGKAFYDLQRVIVKLYETGVLLALCSKNTEETALDAIENHPHMLLRKRHFSAIRINWADKAGNIQSIAEELNLGLDSFVFLDDSPHEREFVRRCLPEVEVPDLPLDVAEYPGFLAALPYFETMTLTDEDRERSRMYVDERQRSEIKRSTGSLEQFLRSLEIKVSIKPPTAFTLPRIAQLTQKTNQFNLTTRRYSEAELRSMNPEDGWRVFSIAASDNIGDSGIVGVAIVRVEDAVARLDTFLMSCRVLGRGIEGAFLAHILDDAARAGATSAMAEYIPTKKNAMAKNFLPENGFAHRDGAYHVSLTNRIKVPDWIETE